MLELEKIADDAEIDTRCIVMRDNGKVVISRTRSTPYLMGKDLVVQVIGIPGCYLASRVYDATGMISEVMENAEYESLRSALSNLPDTWYPDLLRAMVNAAYSKNVFVEGGASTLVKKFEKERE
jgi:hypothetical protein